jgi:hypothetical protein
VAANKILIALAVGAGLAVTLWFTMRPAADFVRRINHTRDVHREICNFEKEIYLSDKKVCLYECPKGEKSRIEGVEKCLKTIEI